MRNRFAKQLTGFLVALALVFQAGLPVSGAVAQSNSVDVASFVCGKGGEPPSARTLQMAHHLAHLLGHDEGDASHEHSGCPLCVLAHSAPLPVVVLPREPAPVHYRPDIVPTTDLVVYAPRGPPVGSQGPPLQLEA